MNATPDTLPRVPVAPGSRSIRPFLIAAGLVILLFAGTYLLAWFRAQSLSATYLEDANASYEQGEFLQALVGSEEYDPELGDYMTRGGYLQVERIWKDPNAQPVPPGVALARQRIDEIVNQHISIEDAEQFIQVNAGRDNPYLGVIYLRLGELYEQEGDERDARDVYESIPDLFSNDPELIQRAQDHLNRLNAAGDG